MTDPDDTTTVIRAAAAAHAMHREAVTSTRNSRGERDIHCRHCGAVIGTGRDGGLWTMWDCPACGVWEPRVGGA